MAVVTEPHTEKLTVPRDEELAEVDKAGPTNNAGELLTATTTVQDEAQRRGDLHTYPPCACLADLSNEDLLRIRRDLSARQRNGTKVARVS
jgi:hypothetical protein